MEHHLTATECHLPYGITQCRAKWNQKNVQFHLSMQDYLHYDNLNLLESLGYPPVKTAWWVILTQCQRVTDSQADRQTDGFTIASTAHLHIATMLTRCKTWILVKFQQNDIQSKTKERIKTTAMFVNDECILNSQARQTPRPSSVSAAVLCPQPGSSLS